MYLETVGDYLGVSRITWRGWLKRGRKEANRLRNPRAKPKESEALYLEFFYTYKKALAEGTFFDLGVIKKASEDQYDAEGKLIRKGEWQAAAWREERRFPKLWGKKDKLDLKGNVGLTVQTVEGVDEDEVLGRKASSEDNTESAVSTSRGSTETLEKPSD